MTRQQRRAAGALLLALTLVTSCRSSSDRSTSPATAAATVASPAPPSSAATCGPPAPTLTPDPERDQTVTIFVMCPARGVPEFTADRVRPVQRVVPNDGAPLRAAMTQLLLGVTPQESAAGLQSAFSTYTAGQVQGAKIDNRIATVEFTSQFERTPNFSATAANSVVMGQIRATVFQFPDVDGLEFKIDGTRWCGWENVCLNEPIPYITRR